jgi:hypothetical protein
VNQQHIATDNHNCGSCGYKCPNGKACHNGKCKPTNTPSPSPSPSPIVCPPGKTKCNGNCVVSAELHENKSMSSNHPDQVASVGMMFQRIKMRLDTSEDRHC